MDRAHFPAADLARVATMLECLRRVASGAYTALDPAQMLEEIEATAAVLRDKLATMGGALEIRQAEMADECAACGAPVRPLHPAAAHRRCA